MPASNATAVQFFGLLALSARIETTRPAAAPAQLRPTTRNVAGIVKMSGAIPANRNNPPNVDLNSDRPGVVTAFKPVNVAARFGKNRPRHPISTVMHAPATHARAAFGALHAASVESRVKEVLAAFTAALRGSADARYVLDLDGDLRLDLVVTSDRKSTRLNSSHRL